MESLACLSFLTSDKQAAPMQAALYLTWHSADGIH